MKNSNAIRNWKLLGFLCLALFAGLFIVSCSDDDNDIPPSTTTTTTRVPYVCSTCPTSSEANVGNDSSENGIYKGVFLGGTVDINFKNNQENVTGKIYRDNRIIDLRESPEIILVDGRRVQALLRGTEENSPVSMVFSVNDDGSNPTITNFTLSGEEESISSMVFKEKSKMLLETFEGNYYKLSNTTVPTGPMGFGVGSKRNDEGIGIPASAVAVSNVRLMLSRFDGMWVMFSPMGLDNGGSAMDHGVIVDGVLRSDVTGQNVARLTGDELNHNESIDSGTLYLYAQRKR